MKFEQIIAMVMAEINRAEELHPYWPWDEIHGGAIVAEETGELVQGNPRPQGKTIFQTKNHHRSRPHGGERNPFSQKHQYGRNQR